MAAVKGYYPGSYYADLNKAVAWLLARQTGPVGNWQANALLTAGATPSPQTPGQSSGFIECGLSSETNFITGQMVSEAQGTPFLYNQIENIVLQLPAGLYPDTQLGPDGYPINESPQPLGWGSLLVNSYQITPAMIAATNYLLSDGSANLTPGPPQTPGVYAKWVAGAVYSFGQMIVDSNNNTQMALVTGQTCASGIAGCGGGNPPNWPATLGALAGDDAQVWKLVALGYQNVGWLALGYVFNLLRPLSYYRVDLFVHTDVFYYQGSSSLYTTALGGDAFESAGTFSVASVAPGLLLAVLYPASVAQPASGWSGAQVPAGWVAHSNMGIGSQLSNYKAQVFVKTDIEYLQEDNIPILMQADDFHARCGSSVWPGEGAPTVHVLYNDPVAGWITVYSSMQSLAAYQGLARSFDVPTSDPLYDPNPTLSNAAALQNRSFIYDDALAIIAYSASGNFASAQKVIQQLNDLLDHPGYLANAVLENGEDGNSASRWNKSNASDSITDVNDPTEPPYGAGLVVDFHAANAGDYFTYTGSGLPASTESQIEWQHSEAAGVGFSFDISVTTANGAVTDVLVTSGAEAPALFNAGTKTITLAIGPGAGTYRTQLVNLASLISSLASDTLSSITGFRITLDAAGDLKFDNLSIGNIQPADSLSFSYDVYNGQIDQAYIRTGAMAWVCYAYALYMQMSTDFSHVLYLQRMLNFLLTLQSSASDLTNGLFYMGYGQYQDPGYQFVPGEQLAVSTEHQVDLWFAFTRAAALLPTASLNLIKTGQLTSAQASSLTALATMLSTAAATIWTNLLAGLYIAPAGNVPGHFAQGASASGLDTSQALDASGAWTAMLADANARDDIALQCLEFAYANFLLNNETIVKSNGASTWNEAYALATPFSGMKPYNDSSGGYSGSPASVWQEGTWGMIAALLRLYSTPGLADYFAGLGTTTDAVLSALVTGQCNILQATGNGSLVGYSLAARGLPWEFEVWPMLAPTAWMWITATNPTLVLSSSTQSQLLPNMVLPDGPSQAIRDSEGSSDVGEFTIECNDPGGSLRSLAAQQALIGQIAVFSMGFSGLALNDFMPLHTVTIKGVGFSSDGKVQITCSDLQRYIAGAMIWPNGGPSEWLPGQPAPPFPIGDSWLANAFPTSDKNPRQLSGHPLDLLLAALQNELGVGQDPALTPILTGVGTTSQVMANPYWVKYVPGHPETLINPNPFIDIPGILALRDGIYGGAHFEFTITTGMQAKSWIEDYILKPLGLVVVIRASGAISLVPVKNPAGLTPVYSFTDSNVIGIPEVTRDPVVNMLTTRLEPDDGGPMSAARGFQNQWFFQENDSINLHKYVYNQQVESTGLRVNYGGYLWSYLLADWLFRSYAFDTPRYKVTSFLSAVGVEVGDYVTLSHRKVTDLNPQGNGGVGISNVLCKVMSRQPSYAKGQMQFELLDARFMGLSTPYQIAPASLGLPVWADLTPAQKAEYMVISASATGGTYSDGTPGNTIF